jgi:hypothetical protein
MFSVLLADNAEGADGMAIVFMALAALVGALFWGRIMARLCGCIIGMLSLLLLFIATCLYVVVVRWEAIIGLVGIVVALVLLFSKRKGRSQ